MKDVGLRIRVQRDLREQFLEVCRAQDKPAAQVLREFMREYVAKTFPDADHFLGRGEHEKTEDDKVHGKHGSMKIGRK